MQNTKVLEMLNNGEIEVLKALLQDEIYKDSLKGNADAKRRYVAMKQYFKWSENPGNKSLNLPCANLEISGFQTAVNSFIDGYSAVLTTESLGEMETFDNSDGNYFKVDKLFTNDGDMEILDLQKVIAEAKSKGYKLKKSEVGTGESTYIMKYKDGYFKIGNLDKAFSIINDGKPAECYYTKRINPLRIVTSVGTCIVLPINASSDIERIKVVIEAEAV